MTPLGPNGRANVRFQFTQLTRVLRSGMLQSTDGDEIEIGGHLHHYDFESEFGQDHILPLKLNESWAARRLMEALSHLPPCGPTNNTNSAPVR